MPSPKTTRQGRSPPRGYEQVSGEEEVDTPETVAPSPPREFSYPSSTSTRSRTPSPLPRPSAMLLKSPPQLVRKTVEIQPTAAGVKKQPREEEADDAEGEGEKGVHDEENARKLNRRSQSLMEVLHSKLYGDMPQEEKVRVAWFSCQLGFIIGGYWLLRSLKDPVFITLVGVEYIPTAKMLSLGVVFVLVLIYNQLMDHFAKHELFYFVGGFYITLLGVIAVLLTHKEMGLANTVASRDRWLGWVSYCAIESMGSIVVPLFWSFVNSALSLKTAKSTFGLIIAGAQIGSILGPTLVSLLATRIGVPALYSLGCVSQLVMVAMAWGYVMIFGVPEHNDGGGGGGGAAQQKKTDEEQEGEGDEEDEEEEDVVVLNEGAATNDDGGDTIAIFVTHHTHAHEGIDDQAAAAAAGKLREKDDDAADDDDAGVKRRGGGGDESATATAASPLFAPDVVRSDDRAAATTTTTKPPEKAGMMEGFHLFAKYSYLKGLFAISCLFEIEATILDYMMKVLAETSFKERFPTDPVAATDHFVAFMGLFGQLTNTLSLTFSLLGTSMVIRTLGLKRTLVLFPTLCFVVVAMVVAYPELKVVFGAMIALKGLQYSLNNPCKEMLYQPTTSAVKFKAKSLIDGIGTRASKAAGSLVTAAFTTNLSSLIDYGGLLAMGISSFLIGVSYFLGQKFDQLVASGHLVGNEDHDAHTQDDISLQAYCSPGRLRYQALGQEVEMISTQKEGLIRGAGGDLILEGGRKVGGAGSGGVLVTNPNSPNVVVRPSNTTNPNSPNLVRMTDRH